jgi:ATP-dependent DNA helicase RecG
MATLKAIEILEQLGEGEDGSFEAKEAAGKDGSGAVPKSFFQTYSAMANTNGGTVVLGVAEKPRGVYTPVGIKNVSAVLKQFWDTVSNKSQVSCNLLTNDMVKTIEVLGKQIIQIRVPRALREQRPVYVGSNPFDGTYRRNHEGDYLCDAETVRRMIAEQTEPNRDSRLLKGHSIQDLDLATLTAYRQQFKASKPDHPWLDLDDVEFLRMIGGWTKCRETAAEGLTVAGLLMFGKLRSILDEFHNYILDYQERPEAKADARWIDRVTTDGTWSGNLFDFYRIVYKRLSADLKVPFTLSGATRLDYTPVHEALREAFVNTLIHADYAGRTAILVVKRPDLFGFRNPGVMRLSLAEALKGGTSDCRNRNLQKMFQLVGLGEQAGSGIPKIWRNWQQEHWRAPHLAESVEPEMTLLKLTMVSLFPKETLDDLQHRFGERLNSFNELQRLALATVCQEGSVTHSQLKGMSTEHSRDITIGLAGLIREGILESDGTGRSTVYYFFGEAPIVTLFDAEFHQIERAGSVPSGAGSVPSGSVPLGSSSVPLPKTSVPSGQADRLSQIADQVRGRRKVSKDELRLVILRLCTADFVTLRTMADLLQRSSEYLRIKHLNEMVALRQLVSRFPDMPSHPHQAYKATRQT